MARLISSLFCVLIPPLLLFPISCFSKILYSEGPAPAPLFIFGDSFFDPGNNNYINTTTLDQANFWPYGETFFKFPTGRFSDGRLVSDFIGEISALCYAKYIWLALTPTCSFPFSSPSHFTFLAAQYAKLPMIPPFLRPGAHQFYDGVNFASAGAGALVETFRGAVRKFVQYLSTKYALLLLFPIMWTYMIIFFFFLASCLSFLDYLRLRWETMQLHLLPKWKSQCLKSPFFFVSFEMSSSSHGVGAKVEGEREETHTIPSTR